MKMLSKSISKQLYILLIILLLGGASQASAKSLWLKSETDERGIFSALTAYRVGDIVTVAVTESGLQTKASGSFSLKSNSSGTITNPVQEFLYNKYIKRLGGVFEGSHPAAYTSSTDWTSGGTIEDTMKYIATFSAMVIDVLPNGNLVIEGARLLATSDDRRFIVLRGIIRPFDISSLNIIQAEKIADAQLEFLAEGAIADVQEKGILTRLSDSVKLR